VKQDPKDPATVGDQIYNMAYEAPSEFHPVTIREGNSEKTFTRQTGPDGLGTYLVKANHVRSPRDITSCNTCHR
jgi:hypothetical protein